MEVLSDPDSINRMLLSQLEQREQQAEQQKKAYTYAASYEDFIKLISTSADVNFLKQLRHDADRSHTLTCAVQLLSLALARRLPLHPLQTTQIHILKGVLFTHKGVGGSEKCSINPFGLNNKASLQHIQPDNIRHDT